MLFINDTNTTPLHSLSDGMVEQFNKMLKDYLSQGSERESTRHPPLLLMTYRTVVHSSTSRTKAAVILGTEIRLPCYLAIGTRSTEELIVGDYEERLGKRRLDIHDQARERTHVASGRRNARCYYESQSAGIQGGDLVRLFIPQRKKGGSPKLTPIWEEPYEM